APGASVLYNYGHNGQSYVLFGRTSGFSASFDLSTLDGGNGFRVDSEFHTVENPNGDTGRPGDDMGRAVSAADVNGDGFADLLIQSFAKSYVVFGSNSGFDSTFDLAALNCVDGFSIPGPTPGAGTIGSIGDINGDGFDDFAVGMPAT